MKKIDLFYNGRYLCSTNQSKTCKAAKARALKVYQAHVKENKAGYSKKQLAEFQTILDHSSALKAYFDKGTK